MLYNILLLILLLILFFINKKTDQFQNIDEQKIYYKYILTNSNNIQYQIFTFSQLNFDLQKKILNKIINNNLDNYYKNIIDINKLNTLVNVGSRYIPNNDLLFAVRVNRLLDEKILSYSPELLFDENNNINYSVLNLQKINSLPNSKLSIYNHTLLLTVPNDDFNITNQNTFSDAIIKDNQISFNNIDLIQIDDLPISLIKLTNNITNITFHKEKVYT